MPREMLALLSGAVQGRVSMLGSGLTFSGSLWLARRRQRMEQRLRGSVVDEMEEKPALVLGDLTPAFSEQVPLGKDDRTELQKELRIAGYYRPTALTEYTALRTLLFLIPLLSAGVLALFVQTATAALYIWGGG